MRNKLGITFMVLGAALFLGALSLFLYNQHESGVAAQTSVELMPQLMEMIEENKTSETTPITYKQPLSTPVEYLDPSAFKMTEVEIDGYRYIGYLSLPTQNINLPVMTDWDYSKLRIAPCRFTGSVRGEDLVIMAHNYSSHFGGIMWLTEGDNVIFTDMDGITTVYEVVGQDVLSPLAVEEMSNGDFDLTLFTCSFSGNSRVTVYCNRAEPK